MKTQDDLTPLYPTHDRKRIAMGIIELEGRRRDAPGLRPAVGRVLDEIAAAREALSELKSDASGSPTEQITQLGWVLEDLRETLGRLRRIEERIRQDG